MIEREIGTHNKPFHIYLRALLHNASIVLLFSVQMKRTLLTPLSKHTLLWCGNTSKFASFPCQHKYSRRNTHYKDQK